MLTLSCNPSLSQEQTGTPIGYALLPFAPESPQKVQPPLANRGFIPQDPTKELSLGIDYLTIVVRDRPWEDILLLRMEIEDWGKTSFTDKPGIGTKHGTYFRNHMKCPLGSKIAYQPHPIHPENWDAIFVVGGKVCGRMGTSKCVGLIREVLLMGGHLSRIDIKTDDYLRDLNYDALAPLVRDGNFTTFRNANMIENVNGKGIRDGYTLNFGSRTGEKCVRIYDALPVHGIDATRCEAEFKGEYANAIGKTIATVTDDESLSRLLGGMLNGTFRITERNDKHNASRVKNATPWENFSNRLAIATKLTRERVTVTLQNKIAWLRDKCSKSLAIFRAYCGVTWKDELGSLLRQGFDRFNADDLALLNASKKECFTRIWCDDNSVADILHNPVWWRDWMTPEVIQSEGYDCAW